MTETVLSSATREVVLGFDRPFVIIGERINPTGRKALAEEMKAGDFSRVERDVLAQVAAGAHMLDVNAGIPLADEPAILAHTIQLVQSLTDLPLSIDSSIVEALEAGLAVYQGKPLVNSVTGEEERLERVLPLVKKYGAAVVAISNDDTGISEDPDVRFAVAKRIVERAADHGIPRVGHRRRPARHADRRDGDRRPPGLRARRAAPRRAQGQLDLRCLERQLRPPQPRGDQRRVPADGHRVGDDLGDHEPDAARPQARRHGRRRPHGQRPRLRSLDQPRSASRRPRARSVVAGSIAGSWPRPAEGRSARGGAIRSSSSRRRVAAAGSPRARRSSTRRGRSASTSIRCAAAAGSAADARSRQGIGTFAKHGITSEPDHLSGFTELEATYRADKGLAAGRRLSCTATVCGDVLIDVPPESQVHRQVVRKDLAVRSFTVDPVVRLHYVEVEPPELASPSGDLARLFEALEREWALTGLEADLEVDPRAPAGPRGGQVRGHGRGPRRPPGDRGLAGLPRHGLRGRDRHRLHDDRRASGRTSPTASVLASNGVMNPQIRFGEDLMSRVSYAMMHPEGAGEMTAAVRKALDGLIASLAMRAGIKRTEILELALVGKPDHAPPAPRDRPDPARRGAVRAGDRPRGPDDGRRAGAPRPPGRAGLRAAVHRGARRRRHRRRDPGRGAAPRRADDARRRRRDERGDRARRSAAAPRRLEPHGPRVRGRADQRRPACGARRHRARPHRSHDARAAVPGHRGRRLVRRARVRRPGGGDRHHRDLRLGDHRGRRRAVPRRVS